MQKNTVKEILRQGGLVYGTALSGSFDAELPFMLKAAGLDMFFVDTEHSTADYHQIQTLCRVARGAGIVPLVRVTENVPHLITRTLDAGAMGLVIPRVHSAAQGRAAVDAMKFPPRGNRGFGMRGIITDYQWTNAADEMNSADHETLVALQIESTQGLAAVDEIAAIPDVDVLFVGPFDLTISMGIAEQFRSEEFWNAVDRVVAACRRAGIAAGIHIADIKLVREARRRGVRFLLYSSDATVLFRAYRDAVGELRKDAETATGTPGY